MTCEDIINSGSVNEFSIFTISMKPAKQGLLNTDYRSVLCPGRQQRAADGGGGAGAGVHGPGLAQHRPRPQHQPQVLLSDIVRSLVIT